ncbi:unnamed protein product [Arabidopsis arenosa]|uniref:FBD domain-containing protein n=1 Tax=Arabidopsis arenosa TaxID=38785 RepID=A0A8S2AD43_ARAAE|nr:unnamed protein product [Arabidopsis arenosa]
MVGNASEFLMGISNVKILYLSSHTLEGLHYRDTNQCWDERYRFKDTMKCFEDADRCVCKPWEGTPICLSSSPVKNIEMLEKVASPKCKIQVISDNISFSSTVHSSSSAIPLFLRLAAENPLIEFEVVTQAHIMVQRGVVEFDLYITSEYEYPLPPEVLMTKTLVRLKLAGTDEFTVDVGEVFLPKLKTLHLTAISFGDEGGPPFAKLISACHALEELVMIKMMWDYWEFCSVSNPFLKRVTIDCENIDENPKSVFDARDLVNSHHGYKRCKGANAADFMMGICNVKTMYLSSEALEDYSFKDTNECYGDQGDTCQCKPWYGTPVWLSSSPVKILKRLLHKYNKACGNVCCCKRPKHPSCLSSSPVKVLKIFLFEDNDEEDGSEMRQIKYFLEKMPRLEELIVYYNTSYDPAVLELSKKLQKIPKIASPKCKIQVISENLSLSSTVPSFLTTNWSALPPEEEYPWVESPPPPVYDFAPSPDEEDYWF